MMILIQLNDEDDGADDGEEDYLGGTVSRRGVVCKRKWGETTGTEGAGHTKPRIYGTFVYVCL